MSSDTNFEISRSAKIEAGPERIFPLIDQFREWTKWSPWEGIDPDLARDYQGPAAGVGGIYSWNGNRKVGEGRMENVGSVPNERVEVELEFIKPFKARNLATFTLKPATGGTEVTWTMTGHQSFFQRAMGKLFRMDAYLGREFEKGLSQLKASAESD